MGSLYVSGTLPTYPSPRLAFCAECEVHVPVRVDVGLGEGQVGSFPEMYNDPNYVLFKGPRTEQKTQLADSSNLVICKQGQEVY